MKPYTFPLPGRRLLCAVLLGTITLLGSCKKDPEPVTPGTPGVEVPGAGVDPLTPTANVSTSVAGTVFDEAGKPLKGVRVLISGQSALTTDEGTFLFENISVPGNRCVITAEKTGYFTGVTARVPLKDELTRTRLILTSSNPTHTISGSTGGKATLSNDSEVEFPANGVVTAGGSPYTGQVNLSVHYQDPSAADFPERVAGGDMLARRTDASTSVLYSYGILRVKLTDSNGEDLQVAPGKTATLRIGIPKSQLATAPATIPLWYFDEAAGVWKEEGEATKQGDQYVGTVKHFTDWNADDPKQSATIIGKVVDCNGKSFSISIVEIGQAATFTEDADGSFSQRVPTGVTIPVTVGPYFAAFPGKVIVVVPPLSPGDIYDVGVIKSDFCPAEVQARLKTKSNDPVLSVVASGAGGSLAFYEPGASLKMPLPANSTFAMKITLRSGLVTTRTIRTGAEGSTQDLGEIDLTGVLVGAKLSGAVICGNSPVADASVKFDWPGKSVTVTTNSIGLFEAVVAPDQEITYTVTHAKGTKTGTVRSGADGSAAKDVGHLNLCTAPSTAGTNSYVISGDGFKNTLKTLVYSTNLSETYYDENLMFPNTTSVDVRDQSDTLRVVLRFAGKTTGAVSPATLPQGTIQRKLSNGKTITYFANDVYEGSQVNITVTRYDAVGGLIEGTYSGTFKGEGQSGKSVTITVTDGKFSAVRGPDVKM